MTGPIDDDIEDIDPLEQELRIILEADRARARRGAIVPASDLSESPIENAMFAALLECGCWPDPSCESLATIYQQHAVDVGNWIAHVDIALVRKVGRRTVRVAIELDGHEFHHHTREQVERDYKRDRALARAGWIVVRFAGSEVYRDAGACAIEASAIVIEAVCRIQEGR